MTASESLLITIIQSEIIWEDKEKNLAHYSDLISNSPGLKEIVILPEMFSTGFSMDSQRLAEDMQGPTVEWMRETARAHRIILAGSIIIKEGGHYHNRLIWMQPDGNYSTYDKRHLFAYATEDKHYSPGNRKLITQVKGWRICPLICYDLRFPIWSRLTEGAEYDVLLYTANWPDRRSLAWKTLLQARAIENQCYVVGVNRVGEDAKGINYSGGSVLHDPTGQILWQAPAQEIAQTVKLSYKLLEETRAQFPFLKDADKFILQA